MTNRLPAGSNSRSFIISAEIDARKWIQTVCGESNKDIPFSQLLHSGVILCNLMTALRPGLIKVNPKDNPLAHRENISNFIKACSSVGLREAFEVADLYDEKNIPLVITTINKLEQHFSPKESTTTAAVAASTSTPNSPATTAKASPPARPNRAPPGGFPSTSAAGIQDSSFFTKPSADEPKQATASPTTQPKSWTTSNRLSQGFAQTPVVETTTEEEKSKFGIFRKGPNTKASSSSTKNLPLLSPKASRSDPPTGLSEVDRIRHEIGTLHADRKLLKDTITYKYPDKYKYLDIYESTLERADGKFALPAELTEAEFLNLYKSSVLNDIFTLTTVAPILEQNNNLKVTLEEMNKMVKTLNIRVSELLSNQSQKEHTQAEDGIIFGNYKGKLEIKGGTPEKFVERLYAKTVAGAVSEYADFFLLTYRSFTTPKKVLEMLTESYNRNLDNEGEENTLQSEQDKLTKKKTRLRICNFLKRWVDHFYEDFDAELVSAFEGFIKAGERETVVDLVKKSLDRRRLQQQTGTTLRNYDFGAAAPATIPPKVSVNPQFDDIDPLEMARQLTLFEYELYRAIAPKEFLSLSWQKPGKETKSPHLLRFIQNFNDVNNWVQYTIVKETDKKKRVSVLKKMLKVVEGLLQLNNFSAMFVFVSALHSASISRMKKTWDDVPRAMMDRFAVYDNLTSMNSSYKAYREALHGADPPCIPYLGVYLSDLTFIEEGNVDRLENGYINFFKCRMVAEVIKEVQQYQQKPYNLKECLPVKELFRNHKILSEGELFKLCLIAEPRES
eukprot:TRINITY_DN5343_c0_g1_i1.p1 TRINITY_DN5343_c0_g1~~TRINITY_DN5343_c0_g1_i1.p1  ORF type:complete len:787 (+),score=167.94 TRINITY_DN5343_c0_g1_i1:194-2554(+)